MVAQPHDPPEVPMDPQISDNTEAGRFEASVDGDVVGQLTYRRNPDVLVLTHTVVEPAAEGKGVGSALARAALDAARSEGLPVMPVCTFVEAWIERHPDYADLVVRSGGEASPAPDTPGDGDVDTPGR
nr:GNAT family N-acetyltransferase [Georgenia faecalis]